MAFILKDEDKNFVLEELKRYESKYSAIIPSLFRIQKKEGWISAEAVSVLSEVMGLPEAHINEVLQFYTMFNKEPVGKLHVQVCTNVSCAMNGGRELAKKICQKYQVKEGAVSQDGMITVTRVECLGACDKAPMMQVNDKYWEDLTQESAIQILEDLKQKVVG